MRYVQLDPVLDPQPYLEILPELEGQLPRGAYRFATDADHYDFTGPHCVHDLELGSVTFSDEPSGVVEVELVGNQWKHDGNLILRYWGLRSTSITTHGDVLGHRALGDLMLDELVPSDGGVRHELAFEGGTVEIAADDMTHFWVKHSADQVVYVFTPEGGRYPAGIWSTASEAETWIAIHDAKGMLSKYEVGRSAYEAAIGHQFFKPKRPDRETDAFITGFTSPIDHWHQGEETVE